MSGVPALGGLACPFGMRLAVEPPFAPWRPLVVASCSVGPTPRSRSHGRLFPMRRVTPNPPVEALQRQSPDAARPCPLPETRPETPSPPKRAWPRSQVDSHPPENLITLPAAPTGSPAPRRWQPILLARPQGDPSPRVANSLPKAAPRSTPERWLLKPTQRAGASPCPRTQGRARGRRTGWRRLRWASRTLLHAAQ